MTSIVSYQKIITPGPNGTTVQLSPPLDKDGNALTTELATLDGVTYVALPDGATLPVQPEGIMISNVTLTPELTQQLIVASPHAQLVQQRQAERAENGETPEKAALWAMQQLQGFGLAAAADVTAAALIVLAARRFDAETGGTAWNGHPVKTDRESQGLVTGALLSSQQAGFDGLGWKMADGTLVTLTAADVQALAQTVGAHVQACFAREAELIPAVQADITADIETGWPA